MEAGFGRGVIHHLRTVSRYRMRCQAGAGGDVMTAMDDLRPYWVKASSGAAGPVEAWSGYPLQFAGQRRFGWQDRMATDLQAALARLTLTPGDVLSGTYLSTDQSRCDVESRLFTNPAA